MPEVAIAISSLLVITGWYVVFRQAIQLKKREEARAAVDSIKALIADLYNLTVEYFSETNTEFSGHISAKIRAGFVRLSRLLILLQRRGLTLKISSVLVEFKQHATGSHFETTSFLLQHEIPNWPALLANSSEELIYEIELAFQQWSD